VGHYKYELTIDKILEAGVTAFPTREITYRGIGRYTVCNTAPNMDIA